MMHCSQGHYDPASARVNMTNRVINPSEMMHCSQGHYDPLLQGNAHLGFDVGLK